MSKQSAGGDTNRSEIIRKYSAEHPTEGPKAISAGLKELGHDISPEYISTVRSLDKKRSKGKASRAPARSRIPAAQPTHDQVSFQALLQAKKLHELTGSIEEAHRAIDALAQLTS